MTTVLYVEDNPANLALVENIIDIMDGFSLLTALNAEEGIEIAIEQQPDIILLDINLPGMNGFEALDVLTSKPETQDIPLIAVTANAMPDDVEKGKASKFKAYITKPIDIMKLINVLNKYVAER